MFAIHGDPATNLYNPHGDHPDLATSTEMLRSCLDHWENFGFGIWAVTLPQQEHIIGFGGIGHLYWQRRDVLDLYYGFTPGAWGNGYATSCARGTAMALGQEYLSQWPVIAHTRAGNIPSIRTAEQAGLLTTRSGYGTHRVRTRLGVQLRFSLEIRLQCKRGNNFFMIGFEMVGKNGYSRRIKSRSPMIQHCKCLKQLPLSNGWNGAWEEQLAIAHRHGIPLSRSLLLQLVEAQQAGGILHLVLGDTSYRNTRQHAYQNFKGAWARGTGGSAWPSAQLWRQATAIFCMRNGIAWQFTRDAIA